MFSKVRNWFSGESSISQTEIGASIPKEWGTHLLFSQMFPKKCMKNILGCGAEFFKLENQYGGLAGFSALFLFEMYF